MDAHPAPIEPSALPTAAMSASPIATNDLKRKRSPSHEASSTSHPPAPPPKQAKTHNQHLQINYLARQYNEDLPLISTNDTLPSILALLTEYQGVLERHESMAGNLGARPLGPILIKRFERLFDGPPKVLKGKEGVTVTWLDVVEFARNKPEQFQLGQMSEGHRVCQFYTKQCRVQISEEDFVLISSGIPQKMIPPQPIVEDEEKELGTLEILEKNLASVCQAADQVAARTRQLNHRIKGRKQAILDRRSTDQGVSIRATSPSNVALMNGSGSTMAPTVGFVAVNARHDVNGGGEGNSKAGAQPSTREELLNKFFTMSDRKARDPNANGEVRRSSVSLAASALASGNAQRAQKSSYVADSDYAQLLSSSITTPPHARTSTPTSHSHSHSHHHSTSSTKQPSHHATTPTTSHSAPATAKLPQPPSSRSDIDADGPYKAEMVSRMEQLAKGERVLPPCDRCRRLHMDCLKNLTACMGCTKKHAKCSWREVRGGELVRGTGFSYGVPVGDDAEYAGWGGRAGAAAGAPAAAGPVQLQQTEGGGAAQQQQQQQQQQPPPAEAAAYASRDATALRDMSISAVAMAAQQAVEQAQQAAVSGVKTPEVPAAGDSPGSIVSPLANPATTTTTTPMTTTTAALPGKEESGFVAQLMEAAAAATAAASEAEKAPAVDARDASERGRADGEGRGAEVERAPPAPRSPFVDQAREQHSATPSVLDHQQHQQTRNGAGEGVVV